MTKRSPLLILIALLFLFATGCDTDIFPTASDETPVATDAPAEQPEIAPTAQPEQPSDTAGPEVDDAGSTDPAAEPLAETVWMWEQFQDTAGINDIAVDNPAAYTITFQPDGTALIQADCNVVTWTYVVKGSSLVFSTLGPSTLAFCGEESLDQVYLTNLGETATYVLSDDGALILNLFADAGNMVFANGEAGSGGLGIDPSQVDIDTEGLPYSWQANLVPESPYDESLPPGPMGLPEHIQVNFVASDTASEEEAAGVPIMYIIPVNEYRELWEASGNSAVSNMMAAIESYINALPDPGPTSGIPVLPYEEIGGVNDLAVKLDRAPIVENGATKNGYRFIGRFAQSPNPVLNDGLRYMYMGLTSDAKYLVAFFAPISNTTLPATVADLPEGEMQQVDDDIEGYLSERAEHLNASTGADWQPGLATLDALISTFTIDDLPGSGVGGNSWLWAASRNVDDGSETLIDVPHAYELGLNADGTLDVTADCNKAGGSYLIDDGTMGAVQFEMGPSTLAECAEGSRSSELLGALATIQEFRLRAGGQQLELVLPDGGGEYLFTLAVPADVAPIPPGGDEAAPGGEKEPPFTGTVWQWEAFQDTAGEADFTVPDPSGYTLVFDEAGGFEFRADCNAGSGFYLLEGNGLTMEVGASTLAECGEESLHDAYLAHLANVATFVLSEGKLTLNLIADAGNLVFGEEGALPDATEDTGESAGEDVGDAAGEDTGETEPPVDPAEPVLTGTVWQWQAFQDTAGINDMTADDPASYTLLFNADNTLNLQADCNFGSATYTQEDSSLTIHLDTLTLTRAYCGDESLDTQFLAFLNDVRTFVFTEDGTLVLNLQADAGDLFFANGGPPQ